jgi:hypothetical protein
LQILHLVFPAGQRVFRGGECATVAGSPAQEMFHEVAGAHSIRLSQALIVWYGHAHTQAA